MSVAKNAPAVGYQINSSFVPQHTGAITEYVGAQGTRQGSQGKHGAKRGCYDDADAAKDSIATLLGQDVAFPAITSRNLDLAQGYPHTMTGIPYSISGQATLISVAVGEYLATFQDPIKAILSTSIQRDSRVIISRKYVVGG